MKIQQEIEVSCQARATFSETGELSLIVSGSAVYDEKTGAYAMARCEVPAEIQAKVKAVLKEAIEACEPMMRNKVLDAVRVSREVGIRLGEVEE